MKHISLTINGVAPSGNSRNDYTASGKRVSAHNTDHTRRYKETAAYQAYRQCQLANWSPIKYGWVAISVYNHLYDRDNAIKVVLDALQKVVYEDDRYLLDGPIRIVKDAGQPRIMLDVVEIEAGWYGYAKIKKDNDPLAHKEWVELHMRAIFE